MNEEFNLFYHALNYRGASSENAELFWKELQSCVDRIAVKKCMEENAELRKYLKISIKEADNWYSDAKGGDYVDTDEINYARKLIGD